MTKAKRSLLAILSFSFVLLLYTAVAPALAVKSLLDAYKTGDAEAMSKKVDFPAVQASFKEQITSPAFMALVNQWTKGNPLSMSLFFTRIPIIDH